MSDEIKTGVETSEYKETKKANVWAVISTVVGLLITVGSAIAASLGADTKAAIIVGAGVASLGIFQRTMQTLGYTKGRSDVKATGLNAMNSNK